MSMHAPVKPAEVEAAAPSRIGGAAAAAKRALDAAAAALLLCLFSPVLLVLALLIKIQDGGPIMYRRRVIGLKGPFDAFKLRTMHEDAEAMLRQDRVLRREFEINFKLKNDPRVTALGKLLRRTSLDELPQLWNVLRGEMSLVGPRMISPAEATVYGESAWIFTAVRPGLTGYWQVRGRQEVSYQKRIELDLFYVQNWSLLLDLQILLETPLRVIRGTGAY